MFGSEEWMRGAAGAPRAGVADQRSHGWRSAGSIERAQARRAAANVRRWGIGSPEPRANRDGTQVNNLCYEEPHREGTQVENLCYGQPRATRRSPRPYGRSAS